MNWCAELADLDKVPLCASFSPMGAKLCKSFGFVEKELVTIKGYNYHLGNITISFQQRVVEGSSARANRHWRRPWTSLQCGRPRLGAAKFFFLQNFSIGGPNCITAIEEKETVMVVYMNIAQIALFPCVLRLTPVATCEGFNNPATG